MPFKKTRLVPEPEEEPTEPDMSKRQRLPSRQEIKDAMRVQKIQKQERTRQAEEIVKVIPGNCEHDWNFTTAGGVYVYTCKICGTVITTQ